MSVSGLLYPVAVKKIAERELPVHLGPAWYMERLDTTIEAGDKLVIRGSKVSVDCNPALVLADEPTANLDHATTYPVFELMKRMRDSFGTTFIFSTHDPKIVGEAETIYTLEDGRLAGTHVKGEASHG